MRRVILSSLLLVSAFGIGACDDQAEQSWYGDEEPTGGKADEATQLTIFHRDEQPTIRRILSEAQIGKLSRSRTGTMTLDGFMLSDDVVLVFEGTLHRYDGTTEEHLMVVQPDWASPEEGAANEAGYLRIDFKDQDRVQNLSPGVDPLGTHAGIFRGQIIATTDLALGEPLPDDLRDLYIRPQNVSQRPANLLRTDLHITPAVTISQLTPGEGDPCLGDKVIDRTVARTDMHLQVALDGFPAGKPVEIVVNYRVPQDVLNSDSWWKQAIESIWDSVEGHFYDFEEGELFSTTVADPAATPVVDLGEFQTQQPFGDIFPMEIEVQARIPSIQAAVIMPWRHELGVVERDARVAVDEFELCPIDDQECLDLRDDGVADNIKANRFIIEQRAEQDGLYQPIKFKVSDCQGGDSPNIEQVEACTRYMEETDSEVAGRVATQAQFELVVNGSAQGNASFEREIPGLAGVNVEGQLKATFSLETELSAKFETSRVWRERNKLDIAFNRKTTRFQRWRVVTPKLYFMEVAEFNQCGVPHNPAEVYLRDLRGSRLVLACESVPPEDFDQACHQVEPTQENSEACNELLSPESPDVAMCLAGGVGGGE